MAASQIVYMTLSNRMDDKQDIVSREGQAFDLFTPVRSLIRLHSKKVYDFLPINLADPLRRRYCQHTENTAFVAFRRTLYTWPDDVNRIIATNGKLVLDGSINIYFSDEKIKDLITFSCVKQYALFFIRWLLMFISLVKFWGPKSVRKGDRISILYGCINGLVKSQDDLDRIEEFLRNNPISGLKASKCFVFHGDMTLHFSSPDSHITRLPENIAVTLLDLSIMERLNLISYHFFGLVRALKLFTKFHGCLSFAEEFGDFFVLSKIAEIGWIAAVIHTTSNSTLQRLWTHNEKVSNHHIYYNIYPIHPVHKSDPNPEMGMLDYPIFTTAHGTHWMWSEQDCYAMQSMYKLKNVKTLGLPLLFYPKIQNEKAQHINPNFDIVICDVTPVKLELFKNVDVTFYYGDVTTACQMINDVIDIAVSFQNEHKRNLNIALKPKRDLNDKTINPKYIDFINQTKFRYDNFSVLSRDTEIHTVSHPKTVFISRPYTSIAKLVSLMGSKSLFYDPTEDLINIPLFFTDIEFSSGISDLKSKMTDAFLDVRG